MTWIDTANEITSGDRPRDYGHPLTNFLRICLLWSVQSGKVVTLSDFVNYMILMKSARNMHTMKEDNYIDTVGYIKCLEDCYERAKILGYEIKADENIGIQDMFECYIRSLEYDKLNRG